jgi:hypothetical protein
MQLLSELKIARWYVIGAIVVQLSLYTLTWFAILKDPVLYLLDFASFYQTGRIVREGKPHEIYNMETQYRILEGFVPPESFSDLKKLPVLPQHPQLLAPLLALIATDNYVTAYQWWGLVNVMMLALCGALIYSFLKFSGWSRGMALLGTVSAICFYPVFTILLKGQDTAFILIGYLVWMIGLIRFRDVAAGFGLSLGIIGPQVTGPLALAFVASRRRAVAWFFVACGLVLAYFLLLVGVQGITDFVIDMALSFRGTDYAANQLAMFNFTGLLLRVIPGLDAGLASRIGWLAVLLVIGGFCVYWWRHGKDLTPKAIGLTVLASVFVAPHLHSHSLSFLLLPWMTVAAYQKQPAQQALTLVFLVTSSIAMLFGDILEGPWRYLCVYLFIGVLAWMLIRLKQNEN